MIEFESVTIENFFSIDHAILYLNEPGAVLVTGSVIGAASAFTSNGSGKTSLFNALVWGLFGKTIRDLPSDEDVIRLGAQKASVTVKMTVDGTVYQVVRSRTRGKPSRFEVMNSVGEHMLTGGTVVETSKMFEDKILRCNFDVFCNTVYFPQGAFTFFTQANDAERKKIFDRLLGTDALVVCEKDAKTLRDELQVELDKHARDRERQLAMFEGCVTTMSNLIEEESEAEFRYTEAMGAVKAVKPKGNPKRLQTALSEALEAEQTAKEAYEGGKEAVSVRKAHKDKETLLRAAVEPLRKVYNSAYQNIGRARAAAEAGNCPTCNQPVEKAKAKAALEEAKVAFQDAGNDLEAAEKAVRDHVDATPPMLALTDLETEYFMAESSRKQAERALKEAEVEEAGNKSSEAVIEAARSEALRSVATRRRKTEAQMQAIEVGLGELDEHIKDADIKLRMANFWITGFGPKGIRSLIFENLMPFINERANHYSSILTDGSIVITVAATSELRTGEKREKISVSAINAEGSNVYEGNSGGERKRVDLCILLALQDLLLNRSQGAIRLSVYDELLDELDEEGIERVVELLKERGQKQPVFLISHNVTLKGFFEDVIVVNKLNGVSRLSEVA